MSFKTEKLVPGVKMRVVGRRASIKQKEVLISYLEKNLNFAHFLSDSPKGNELLKQQWQNLADVLNNLLDDEGGAYKSGLSWRKYWLDLREYTKQRAAEGTRRKSVGDIEKRIMNIVNWVPDEAIAESVQDKSDENLKKYKLAQASRIKNGRASDLQKEELIKYFEENADAIHILQNTGVDNGGKYRIWIELTHRLNSIDGVMKPSLKWVKYWNDIVAYTKNRAKIVISRQGTGYERPPTELERRMLRVVHQEDLLQQWEQSCDGVIAVNTEEIHFPKKEITLSPIGNEEIETLEEDWTEYEEFSAPDDGATTSFTDQINVQTSSIKTDKDATYELTNPNGETIYLEDSTDGFFDVIPVEDETVETMQNNGEKNQYHSNAIEVIDSLPNQPLNHSKKQKDNNSKASNSVESMKLDNQWDTEDAEEEEYNFEEDLANAVYQLGAATQNLATALQSIANVLVQRRQNKAKRPRYN